MAKNNRPRNVLAGVAQEFGLGKSTTSDLSGADLGGARLVSYKPSSFRMSPHYSYCISYL